MAADTIQPVAWWLGDEPYLEEELTIVELGAAVALYTADQIREALWAEYQLGGADSQCELIDGVLARLGLEEKP